VIVDVHTHFLPPEVVTASSPDTPDIEYDVRIGDADDPELFTGRGHAAGFCVAQLTDLRRRQADMDVMGVDVQVLSVPPPFGFFYGRGLQEAQRLGTVLNEGIAAAVAAEPRRFLGLATLPMQDSAAAIAVLEHSMRDLGLHGAEIASRVGDKNLDDPSLDEFFAAAESLGAVIFVHSTRGIAADRLADYHLGNLIGNPTEDAIAAASLIFGGRIEQHPDLRLYIAHGGGSCPAISGRWDRGWEIRPEARRNISQPPSSYLRRMSFDSLTHSSEQLENLVRVTGPGQVLVGTDYPYDMADPDPVGRIRRTDLAADVQEQLLSGNAARMFNL
jgi:aminocarboxymuconate-semialdehyde decarboxylase